MEPAAVRAWTATSLTGDFRESDWEAAEMPFDNGVYTHRMTALAAWWCSGRRSTRWMAAAATSSRPASGCPMGLRGRTRRGVMLGGMTVVYQ
jgi:hypothetical protein